MIPLNSVPHTFVDYVSLLWFGFFVFLVKLIVWINLLVVRSEMKEMTLKLEMIVKKLIFDITK